RVSDSISLSAAGRVGSAAATRRRRGSMRRARRFVIPIFILVLAAAATAQDRGGQRAAAPAGPPLTLTIAAFPDGSDIPVKFSQAAEGAAPGEGTSPAMAWTNVPAGTQSFVLHMHDMDV